MINKYHEFITESQIEMLFEANMAFSNDFMFVMQEILNSDCSGRRIARLIMDHKNLFVNINDNYLDISDNPTMVKFTPDDKVKEEDIVYKTLSSTTALNTDHDIIKNSGLDASKCIYLYNNQLMQREWKLLSKFLDNQFTHLQFYLLQNYNDSNEQVVVYSKMGSDGLYKVANLSNRSGEVRIGRFINKFLSALDYSFTQKEIEEFVNKYQTVVEFKKNAFNNFKVVDGEDIRYWYNIDNYANDKGQLGSSCMRGKECEKFFDIYCENTDVCKLLIFTDNDNRLIGRSLLWKLDDGRFFMDRIYTNKDNYSLLFETWAKKNKYITQKELNFAIKVLAKVGEYKFYPYLDTLQYYAPNDGMLSSTPNTLSHPILELDSTVGTGHIY